MAEIPSQLEHSPERFAHWLAEVGGGAWLATRPDCAALDLSHSELAPVARYLREDSPDYREHEAIFFRAGEETGALFAAFIHKTKRGQAQGGVRHWSYDSLAAVVSDGLRLALGMGRKCAVAGLWWGGGKAIIARQPDRDTEDPGYRRTLYGEFGRFVTSLQGCYVTAEDAGTTPADMAEIFRHTRFATCVPAEVGGSGNPSAMTAAGVVSAMEAALDVLSLGDLRGKRIAMQGAGNVGTFMIEQLFERGAEEIVATELSAQRRQDLLDHFADRRLEVHLVEPGDTAILATDCDILAPNALGGVLGPKTIGEIRAPIVCGAANNPLVDEVRDAEALERCGILFVPDYVANQMGIVACSNEHAGCVTPDPEVERRLDPKAEDSVYQLTRRILNAAREKGVPPMSEANRLADARSEDLHPIWGHRARAIIESLTAETPRPTDLLR